MAERVYRQLTQTIPQLQPSARANNARLEGCCHGSLPSPHAIRRSWCSAWAGS